MTPPRDRLNRPPEEEDGIGSPDDADLTAFQEEMEEEGGQRLRWTLTKQAKFRLDKWLQNNIKSISRNKIQQLIELGGVTVNSERPKPSQKLRQGDVIEVVMPPRPATDLQPEPVPLHILYEDEDFIVVNKQAGLIVHPARTHLTGTLLNGLLYHFQKQAKEQRAGSQKQESPAAYGGSTPHDPRPTLSSVGREEARPGVVHRLDMNTTGCMVVAKRDETHWLLARQFEHRTNLKVYLALVHGCPDLSGGPGGAFDQPIGKHPTIREAMAVRYDSGGKDCLTLYRVRERYHGYSLVELELKSGRTHQIRVHLSYAGCPIVGDILYGGEPVGTKEIEHPPRAAGSRTHLVFARDKATGQKLEAESRQRAEASGGGELIMFTPALHAALLELDHPVKKQRMRFTAPVHSPMREMIHELRKHPAEGPILTEGTHIDLEKAVP